LSAFLITAAAERAAENECEDLVRRRGGIKAGFLMEIQPSLATLENMTVARPEYASYAKFIRRNSTSCFLPSLFLTLHFPRIDLSGAPKENREAAEIHMTRDYNISPYL